MSEAIDGDAVILAGGQSSRMGEDKARIPVGGETLIARLAGTLAREFRRVHVSIDPARPYPELRLPSIPDGTPGLGPLEGIRAALASLGRPAFFAAVDLPGIPGPLARALFEEATREGRRGAIPRWRGGLEPACAAYSPALLPEIERALAKGRRDLQRLAALPGVILLDLEDPAILNRIFNQEIPLLATLFQNLNRREDLEGLTQNRS